MNADLSQTDVLTGLLNRKSFDERFKDVVLQGNESERAFSLAFLDIDDFFHVNSQYGHSAGDGVLVAVAETIRLNVAEETVVSRYGGDEFALLFMNTEREQAFLAMERIRALIEQIESYETGDRPVSARITVSAGIASFPIDARTENELLRKADQALYRAKQIGRNQVRLAYEERMVPKTTHYTQTQLERLSKLAEAEGVGEAVLLREALDNLLLKYRVTDIET